MYYCGWDGGGTKTGVCALDEAGHVIAETVCGPLNLNGAAAQTVARTVEDCVRFMAGLPGGLAACGGLVVGAAGVSNRAAREMLEDTIQNSGYAGPLRLLGDQEIALEGAVEGPGAILIAGTGSVCYGRDAQGSNFRTGGYGYLIDDGGSGYAIGRDILMAVVRAFDGRGPETCLTDGVFKRLDISEIGPMITWLYAPATGKKEIAALSDLLLPALEAGDAAARQIAERAAEELSRLVIAAWKKAGMTGGEVALTGSIFKYYPLIRGLTQERLEQALPGIRITEPRRSPAQGAAQLARRLFYSAS